MQDWNPHTKTYKPYEVPADWNCKLYCNDLEEVINCASCGRKVKFGNCYSSLHIHSDAGLGYAVCKKCNEMERKLEKDE